MAIQQASWGERPMVSVNTPPGAQRRAGSRLALHVVSLLLAVACFAAYGHFKLEGRSTATLVALVLAAVFAFLPVRDVLRVVFRIEGKALHFVHALGALALVGLPLSGVVSGAPVLARTWMAPFAIMGAAQAVMHQDHPRNAKQAAALQRFAASLPEVAQFAGSKDLTSPATVARAVAVLSDIIGKAQSLGETELSADPNFQGALQQVSTRFASNLGLDVVDLALRNLAGNPAAQRALPDLQSRLAKARRTMAAAGP
jgi:hypothetical protein